VASHYERCDEPSGFINNGEFRDDLLCCYLLKKGPAPVS
jgi:hypothetical protein